MWNNQGKECESCKRDGVECRYSSPGKRVNHVKLLCQNFETLEGQLHSIQNDLSDLTSLVKGGSSVRSLSLPAEEWAPESHSGTDSTSTPHTNRHIVRSTSQSLDRYHGPCSLYALCKEFSDHPLFSVSENNNSGENAVSEHLMLQEMLNEASNEPHLDMLSHPVGICLPPRQFLNLVIGPFFKNVDYATDVFVRSNFQPHVDRIYSQPIGPADEGWAVCFNVVVLLGIKKEPTIQGNSHFVQTLLQTLKMAVNNPRVFLTPRLVNVQALALLSYVAEQYSTTSLAELVFAQACLLARTMGLHQSNASSDGLPPEDILERHKVFRSLYIRDKNIAIFRGSTAWLPGYDSGVPPSFDEAGTGTPELLARLELAKLQDEVYQAFHAAGAPNLHHSRHNQVLAQLQQRLEQWSSTHSIMQRTLISTETFSLVLSFFATRICLSKDNGDMRSTQPFKDAKACCLVFLLATATKPDLRLSETLKEMLGQQKFLDQPSSRKTKRNSRTQPAVSENNESATSSLPRLAATFPLAAAFIVAKDILLQPMGEVDGTPGRPEEEITILEALRDRFATAAEQAHVDNLALSFSRILGLLVRVVRQKRSLEANNAPSLAFNDLPSLHSTRSSSSLQESVVSSFRDTPPGPENFSTVSSISEAVSNSSLLLPFTQPVEDSASGSPWFTNVGQNIGLNNNPVLMSWPIQHKRQSEEADHITKRARISCQEEYLDIPAVYQDHGSRTEDDSLFTFDFLNTGTDISVFDMED
ncbi:GAL4-like transcriptional activator [Fusarium mexicanum]|uniref:GAL4-like transcriptional activator n=1 Tax=Fusarium mexicanum TaxID=751941 RepID=A0A8H5IB12_9HYPO|nr:GAL4-like transcriptional activator [Fusarium mexicanum]